MTPFSLRKDVHAQGTDFVVGDIRPDAREELDGLDWLIPGVEPRGDEYAFTYTAGTPYVDAGFENLSRSAAAMWRQHTGVERADWEGAFRHFLSVVDGAGIDWALIGGVALAIRGVTAAAATPDVDIITTPADARRLDDLLSDRLTSPTVDLPMFGWFGRAFIGARVEWLGNDQHANAWRFDYSWEEYEWDGRTLLVPPLELYLKIEQGRGRTDRAEGIQAVLGA
ncbi:MAG: hypothetical protein WD689_03915 [Gaiellaceae bacterium]